MPPVAYGGTELAVDSLARGLAARGHAVTLFTVGRSTCRVDRRWLYDEPPPVIGAALPELRHAAAAHEELANCDLIHDHSLAGVLLAARQSGGPPVVTTNHGPFSADLVDLYRRAAGRVPIVAISADQAGRAPARLPVAAVIHHGLDLARYPAEPLPPTEPCLAVLARMHPSKGIDVAIEVALRAGMPLVIAAKMREPAERAWFEQAVRPRLGATVSYIGEVDHRAKTELLRGAAALLNPIHWDEPFGLAMIEALACATPVVATTRGSAPEIVTPGVNGFLADSVDDLVAAIGAVGAIDRRRCRADAQHRFSMASMAAEHEAVYRRLLASARSVVAG